MKKGNVKNKLRRRQVTRIIISMLIAIIFLYNILYINKINRDIATNKLKIRDIQEKIDYLNYVASESERKNETIDELDQILSSIKSKLGLDNETDSE